MIRWAVAGFSILLIALLSIGSSEAAKAKRKPEKMEYLRAAGAEPPATPAKQTRIKPKPAPTAKR